MTRQVDTSTLERAVRLLSEYANSGVPDAVSLECAQVCGKLRNALTQPPAEPERALVTELEILRRGWERDAIVIYAQATVREADGSTTWLDNECRTEHDTLRRCAQELRNALTQPTPEQEVSE